MAQASELAEVILLCTVVGDATAEAEQERTELEPDLAARAALVQHASIGSNREPLRNMLLVVLLDTRVGGAIFPPMIGQVCLTLLAP